MSENASDRTRDFFGSGKPLRNAKKLRGDSHGGMLHQVMLDRSPDLAFLLGADGRFLFINDAVERLLGYAGDGLLGHHYSRIVLEDDLELARNLFTERSGGVQQAELRLRLHPSRAGPRPAQSTTVWTEIKVSHLDSTENGLAAIFATARDVSERREAEESLVFHAHHDWLTHLPNRVLLNDRLDLAVAQAQRGNRRLAVVFLDLDRFKLVNDRYGHTVGDRLLQAVAKRLQSCLGQGDTISRFGGDEFALLLPGISTKRDAVAVVRRVVRRIRDGFIVDGNELKVSASIGVAMYPDAGVTAESLVQSADIAMYRVKNRGGNGYRFFAEAMNRRLSRRFAMERELRTALAEDALSVYYQPRVHLESGTIVGVEALARWAPGHSPEGIVEANEFLPVAEETGLISQIDAWVQRHAFDDVARWRAEGFKPCLSVNASPQQIEGGDFVQHIDELLHTSGLPAHALALEITEETLTRDIESAVPKLDYLRRRGVRIVIDDFGTGYSSLSHLRRFPIDALKLDHRFVSGIEAGHANIVEAIAGIARGLRLDLMAEGVETRRELAYLREHGCLEAQGFLFSRPISADEMVAVLRADPYRSLDAIGDVPTAR